ncbi:MbtH family protein [Actinoplanes couchii]|uniref:MbtH protein n=1 Tax=Actinoplanes couchii TaxID=403638 RepID=A0ABQ3XTC8_9ACTN|nr:MbtH family protein [Actinoplanes couchii]MDR6324148.1 MbtH protein [Actinoplanes couchii]GID61766.1 MbtH protein [Actinoplanes couchii]
MFDDSTARFTVVINDEEQYSVWPTAITVPDGWREIGVTGTKDECLERIEEIWTDLRPRSLREQLAADGH